MSSKLILLILAIFPVIILLYLVLAFIGSMIPVNSTFKEAENGISIYIKSNGLHTDFIVPVDAETFDWSEKIMLADFKGPKENIKYIEYGLGEKGYFLSAAEGGNIKINIVLNAMFMGTSALHVSCYNAAPNESTNVKKIQITPDQYLKITAHIDGAFQKDIHGKYKRIKGVHYIGRNDNFYEGKPAYHLFYTSNSWTNDGLKKAGINTALFAPFAQSVMRHRN